MDNLLITTIRLAIYPILPDCVMDVAGVHTLEHLVQQEVSFVTHVGKWVTMRGCVLKQQEHNEGAQSLDEQLVITGLIKNLLTHLIWIKFESKLVDTRYQH